ncbi:MAG: DUF2029 domain-containing protein [Planctomycetes bacterium]|nr:DUF2029 domain-containing protein [Planctomycetota bacterium]
MLREGTLQHVRRHWAVFGGLVIALAIWCSVDVARRAVIDPTRPWLHMTDFSVYTEAGAAFFDGRAPYDVQNIRGWKYVYPPLFALLVSPLSRFSSPIQASVWFGISALLCFGIYFECRRLLAAVVTDSPRAQRLALWCGLAAGVTALFPALNCLQRGQVGVALLYPLLWGTRLLISGRTPIQWFTGGVILALPVVIKLTPILPVGCLVLCVMAGFLFSRSGRVDRSGPARGERHSPEAAASSIAAITRTAAGPMSLTAGVLFGGFLFALLIPSLCLGWQANWSHLQTWYYRVATKVNHDRTDRFAENGCTPRNQSLTNAIHRFGNWAAFVTGRGPDDRIVDTEIPEIGKMPMDHWLVARGLQVARGAATLLLLAVMVALGRCGDRLSLGFALGLACVATLVVSPVSRGHYFLLFVPAVMFGGLWMWERCSARAASAIVVIPLTLCVLHYLALNVLGRIGVLGIGTAIWFAAVCSLVLAHVKFSKAVQPQAEPVCPPSRIAA